jgi:hypothetical protein
MDLLPIKKQKRFIQRADLLIRISTFSFTNEIALSWTDIGGIAYTTRSHSSP